MTRLLTNLIIATGIILSFELSLGQLKSQFGSDNQQYRVQRHQWLADILRELKYKPLWGPNGYVEKTLQLNPKLLKSNGDRLLPSTVLNLPQKKITLSNNSIKKNPSRKIASYSLSNLGPKENNKNLTINIDCREAGPNNLKQQKSSSLDVSGTKVHINVYCGQKPQASQISKQLNRLKKEVSFIAGLSYNAYNLEDQLTSSKAKIASKQNFILGINWKRSLSEHTELVGSFTWRDSSFQDSNIYTIQEQSKSNTSLSFGVRHQFASSYFLNTSVSYAQNSFFKTLGGTEFYAHSIARPSLSATLEKKITLFRVPWLFYAKAKYLSSASKNDIQLKSGSEFSVGTQFDLRLQNSKLSPFIMYSNATQDSSQLKHQYNFLNLGIFYEY